MRIGVISDTHGNLTRIEMAVKQMGKIDALLHAGDFGEGFKEMNFPFPVYVVRGNCDWDDFDTPEELSIILENKKFLLTHGHKYDVKTRLFKLEYLAKQEEADIVIFGHSHELFKQEIDDVIYLNPGSLTRPRGGNKPSYAIVEISNDEIQADIISLENF